MSDNTEFIALNNQGQQFASAKKKQKTGVIKRTRNQTSGVVVIQPEMEESDDGVEFFQPIYEGDLVVGVLHKCVCGRTAELRFQYSEQ